MNSIKLKPDIYELYRLNEFIHKQICKDNFQIDLILEEIFTNIVNYSNTEFITVKTEFNNEKREITIEFIDNGIKFNPLEKEDPLIAETIEDAPIGGRGIFLVKSFSDSINYNYINNENHLKISKIVE